MRLDVFLCENGFYKSRSKAADAIKQGLVTVDGEIAKKASEEVCGSENITALPVYRFVSRAGEKLEHALNEFGINPAGVCALDIGASTGGFTDCLLQHGAEYVYALDVGHSQLDKALRTDGRVCAMEGINARNISKKDFNREIGIITMDVSFVSQTLIYPACSDILGAGKPMITLVKPQFEVGRENIGKGGIVRDTDGSLIKEIMANLDAKADENGFERLKFTRSPILGGDGNAEYLALFRKI